MDLKELRVQIDDVDRQMVALFVRRMEISEQIGLYKKAHDLPTGDRGRERDKLEAVAALAPEALREPVQSLYEKLFELSRGWQNRVNDRSGEA